MNARVMSLVCVAVLALSACVQATPEEQVTGKNERCCKANPITKTCIDKRGGKKCAFLINNKGYTKGKCGVNCIVGPTPDPNGKNERCCKANPVTRTCIDKKGGKKCAMLIATQGY